MAVKDTLMKNGKKNKDIAALTGISLRTVQRWTKKIEDSSPTLLPTHKQRSGRKQKLTASTLNLLKQQVDAHPSLTARQLKEKNPRLLAGVALRMLQDYLRKVLGF